VLLDEATAAIDAEIEALFHDALRALTADRTLLVIAHRLQTIAAADQILVLHDGGIAERGTHDELPAAPSRYAALSHQRTRAAGDSKPPPSPIRRVDDHERGDHLRVFLGLCATVGPTPHERSST
jgi:ABC-type multidrug transport system ATPase subunit